MSASLGDGLQSTTPDLNMEFATYQNEVCRKVVGNCINNSSVNRRENFDVLLTVQLSTFVSVINQLGAQNFCFTICFAYM